jgi:hypothetical protein
VVQLILFLAVGALLLLSLYFFARRLPQPGADAKAMFDARRALSILQMELLPPEMVARIFAREDLDYVNASASKEVHIMFLAERGRIALSWVRYLRGHILSLRRFHLGSARHHAHLNFRTEVTLAVEFAILLFACRVLEIMLWIRGPYGAPQTLRVTTAAAARVCEISERSLRFLWPESATPLGNPSTGNRATL